jgi:putative phosphoesterase
VTTILVLSDSHGDIVSLKTAIRGFGARADLILHAGDGAEDLTRLQYAGVGLKPWEGVRGNSDANSSLPLKKTLEFRGKRILLCHGHLHSIGFSLDVLLAAARAEKADIVVYGHSHRPFRVEIGGILALNPGSLSRPRGREWGSFAVIEWDEGKRCDPRFYELCGPGRKRIREIKDISGGVGDASRPALYE